MLLAVTILKWVSSSTWPLYVRFTVEVTGGAVAYLVVLLVLHGARLRGMLSLYRGNRANGANAVN